MPSTDTQTDRQTRAKIRVLQDFRKSDQQTNSGKNKGPSGFSQIGPTDRQTDRQTHTHNEYSGHLLTREPITDVEHIVTNSRPPACERPRLTNNGRFAHRTCNSVATFRNNAGNQSRVCFGHTTTLSVFYPRVTGSDRRIIDLPKYSRG